MTETPAADQLDFTCPRCASPAHESFYGPCTACRAELAATVRGVAKEVAGDAFEPKMNVVPNQVATKD